MSDTVFGALAMLTDAQIDRYSRQIVLPGIGGRGQQRLLDCKLVVISALDELEPALSYLVGAGVGTISIRAAAGARERHRVDASMNDLNPDAKLVWGEVPPRVVGRARRSPDAILILSALKAAQAAGGAAAHFVPAQYSSLAPAPTVAAHLGEPLELVVLPARPPCLDCVGARCFKPPAPRAADWEMVAMMAVGEVLKLLLALGPSQPQVLRFRGLNARPRRFKPRAHCLICER